VSAGEGFFLKKEAKTFASAVAERRRQRCKSFLVLFFKKELLALAAGDTCMSRALGKSSGVD
jgi:hypothetical protein